MGASGLSLVAAVVMCCVVEVCCGVWWCVCSAAVPFAPAVCYSKREPNIKEYWEQKHKQKFKKTLTKQKLIKTQRCVVVADGFYEWKRTKGNKIPYYFFRNDKKTIFIAAIYDEGQFCMITEEASQNISEIHHRQPVILYEKDIDKYLNIEHFGSTFLKECNKVSLTFHEISKDVNKPTNNSASLIQQI